MTGNDWCNCTGDTKFVFLLHFSVKEGSRETAKRQTEHNSTLRRWMPTLTWLRLTWKRYVSSHSCGVTTNRTSLSCTLLCRLPGFSPLTRPPSTRQFPLGIFFYIPSPPPLPYTMPPALTSHSSEPWKTAKIDWPCVSCQGLCVKAGIVSAAQWSAANQSW